MTHSFPTHRSSRRRLLRKALAPLVDAVAVFRDNPAGEVRDVVGQVRPSLLQFHGDEDDAFCRGFGVPYVKAIGMGNALVEDAVALQVDYPGVAAFLFDSHGGGIDGGSGRAFDWSDRKSTRLNSSHYCSSRMPSSA